MATDNVPRPAPIIRTPTPANHTMKIYLRKSFACLLTLIAMLTLSTAADAKVITFSESTPLSQGNVTVTIGAYPGSRSHGICNIYGTTNATMSIVSAFDNITKVEFTCAPYNTPTPTAEAAASIIVWDTTDKGNAGGTTCITTSGGTVTWEGTPTKTLEFGSTDDVDVITLTVTTAEGGNVTYMQYSRVTPAEGNISAKNGLRHFDIFMKDDFAATYSTFWGHPVPAGTTMTDAAGRTYPISTFSSFSGSNQLNVELAQTINTPGTYTLTIPEGFNSGRTGITPKMQFTWTIEPTSTFDVESSLIDPQDYPALKALDHFSLAAPEGLTFAAVRPRIILQRQGRWNSAKDDFDYTPIEVTAAIKEGKVVFTFPTPYVEQGNVRFNVPAGVITTTSGLTNEPFGASFTLDPYEYFAATSSLQPWTTYEAPLLNFTITVPRGVTIASVGNAIEVDGRSTPVLQATYDNTTHVVDVILQDELAPGIHIIYIPQGFITSADNAINREIELYGVKVLGTTSDFPYTSTTPAIWSSLTNASLAETPITITFLRDLASVEPARISIQAPGATKTIAEFNAETPGAVTLTISGKNLNLQFSPEFLNTPPFANSGQIYIQLQKGAVTTLKGAQNEENLWGIGFDYEHIGTIATGPTGWTTLAPTSTVVIPEGYTAYYVSAITDDNVILTPLAQAGQTVNAYVPFILHGTPNTIIYCSAGDPWGAINVPWGVTNFLAGNYEDGTPHTYQAYDIAYDPAYWDYNRDTMMGPNSLYALTALDDAPAAARALADEAPAATPVFALQPGTLGRSVTIPQGQAYLIVPEHYTTVPTPKTLLIDDGSISTHIHAIPVTTTPANPAGHALPIYNLHGQPANPHTTGVHITGGRKHISK